MKSLNEQIIVIMPHIYDCETYSAQEEAVGEASLPSPSTGLKTGRTPT